jgi:hypothetical protein
MDLNLMIDRGQFLASILNPGNVDDRKPVAELIEGLFGKLFAQF